LGKTFFKRNNLLVNKVQGPVPQSPIGLILDWWKILIAIYLPLGKDFSQD